MNQKALLHLLNEFAPVIVFFLVAQFTSFYTATAVLLVSTCLALAFGWYFERRFPVLPIIAGLFVIVSGSITLYYHAPDALIFADSLYYLLMGLTIAVFLVFHINLLKLIFEQTFAMSDKGWFLLCQRWIIIFLLAAVLNEFARHYLTPEMWVNFKMLKVVSIGIFGLYQFTLARKYRLPDASPWGLRVTSTKV